MKKLGKLKLNNFSEMSEQEMKFVIGGQYDVPAVVEATKTRIVPVTMRLHLHVVVYVLRLSYMQAMGH